MNMPKYANDKLSVVVRFLMRRCPYPAEPIFELATDVINAAINEIFLNLYRIETIELKKFRNNADKYQHLRKYKYDLLTCWNFIKDKHRIELYSAYTIKDGALCELVKKGLIYCFEIDFLNKNLEDIF